MRRMLETLPIRVPWLVWVFMRQIAFQVHSRSQSMRRMVETLSIRRPYSPLAVHLRPPQLKASTLWNAIIAVKTACIDLTLNQRSALQTRIWRRTTACFNINIIHYYIYLIWDGSDSATVSTPDSESGDRGSNPSGVH